MAKRKLTAQQITDKQVTRASQAVNDYVAGVSAVTESPNAKAAAKVNKYQQGVNDAVTSGAYVNGNNAVTLQQWQNAAKTKGQRNYAQGVKDAQSKILAFNQTYGPVRD